MLMRAKRRNFRANQVQRSDLPVAAKAERPKGVRYLTATGSVTNSRKPSAIQDLQIWVAR